MSANDLTIYSEFAHEWWIVGSPRFRSLQNLTPFRLSLIHDLCGPVNSKDIVDLGCGGGLISIPLIEAGANVVGIDLSAASLCAARAAGRGRGTFMQGDICNVALPSAIADIVIMADVLDHVPHYAKALREATRLLKPQGKLFVGTLNRNPLSWFLTIFLSESIGLIPRGTHDYKLLLRPRELCAAAEEAGLELCAIQGEWPKIWSTLRHRAIDLRRSSSLLLAYSMLFKKVAREK